MNVFYFLQRYLDKLNDIQFGIKWEKLVQNNIKRFFTVMVIIWLLGSTLFGYFIGLLVGIFFSILLTIMFSIYFGYIIFIQSIKFLAVNNTRYIQSKMNIDETIINYDNVVG